MSNAHRGSRLQLSGNIIPVDFSSIHFDYDRDETGIAYGSLIESIGSPVFTMRPLEGKFGGGIAIEEGTTNLSNITASTTWINSGSGTSILPSYVPSLDLGTQIFYCGVTGNTNGNIGNTLGSATGLTTGNSYSSSMWIWTDTAVGENGSFPYVRVYSANNGNTSIGTMNWYDEYGNSHNSWDSIPHRQWIRLKSENIPFPIGYDEIRCSFYLNNTGSKVYFTAPQVEKKIFTTSFVNGTRAIGSLNYQQIEIKNTFTVSAWVKCSEPISDFTTYHKNALCYFTDPLGTDTIEFFPRGNQTNPKIAFWSTSSWYYGNSVLQPNIWYHVAYTWDGTNMRIYVNGTLDNTIAVSHNYAKLMNLNVGGNSSETLNGLISDLKIDKFTSSDEDIMSIYLSNRPLYNPYDYRATAY